MNWVNNHTCKNCKWSAKGWIDEGIFFKSNDYYAKHCCIYRQKQIPGAIDCCTCNCWAEDKEAVVEEKYTEDGLKYCSCGHKPKCFKRKFNDGEDWAVWCEHCDKMAIYLDKQGAIRSWNYSLYK